MHRMLVLLLPLCSVTATEPASPDAPRTAIPLLLAAAPAPIAVAPPRPQPESSPPLATAQAAAASQAALAASAPPAPLQLAQAAGPGTADEQDNAAAPDLAPGGTAPSTTPPAAMDPLTAATAALDAARHQRWADADAAAAQASPLIAKFVLWMRLQTRNAATGPEIATFLAANPDWPLQGLLARRAEDALANDPDDAVALRFFAAHAPVTLPGAQRYADALQRAGRATEAALVLRRGWAEGASDAVNEPIYWAHNSQIITPADAWQRFDRLDIAGDQAGATRAAAMLTGNPALLAGVRLALSANASNAVLQTDIQDVGLALDQARWLRRQDRDPEAAALWHSSLALQRSVPAATARAIWSERQILTRKLLREGDAATAYTVVSEHGQESGEARQDAEFLAGFIALRKLNQPTEAAAHFARIAEGSQSGITRARAFYWQGRAAAAAGDSSRAQQFYQNAAAFPFTYYGQLGALAAGESMAQISAQIRAAGSPQPTEAERDEFAAREMTRLVIQLSEAGETRRTRLFLLQLAGQASAPGEVTLAADLAISIGRPDHAVWIARRSGAQGLLLPVEGWPVPYSPPSPPEAPFTLGIIRQESNFDTNAVSPSNAQGLMQLLPSTAQHVAKQLGIAYNYGQLQADPAYNMTLGTDYLAQQLARFGGVPFAAAAYNAGPRRVDEWLTTNGDPRAATADIIDWIELIPFNETRNYVQRVIENMVVYRARNSSTAGLPHPLAEWLNKPVVAAPAPVPPSTPAPAAGSATANP